MALPDPPSNLWPPEVLLASLSACLAVDGDNYKRLNTLRDWVNAHLGPEGFELYLEDVWNEHCAGQTRFEYILRSTRTLEETPPIGYDLYQNHQDAKGVWHLDDYLESVILMPDLAFLVVFFLKNRSKNS